uniref:Uncharacterized protein n=1 Tax=Panagrolaimus superbus TaxID=310955 RepID=A0A914XY59_9BILA
MKVNYLIAFCCCFSKFIFVKSDFSLHFRNFLILRYGADVQRRLERSDIGFGILGSFGGKIFETDIIKNDPIIFVHAASCRAGSFLPNYFHFLFKGYIAAEMYSTTWGNGRTPVCLKTLACDDVKQIRGLIVAVNEYTNRTVDIIAFGEGSAIARKAILGGTCVDIFNDTLGQPLTPLIDTFVSVGGLNYGKQNCTPQLGGCNLNNGQHCSSEFMRDINNQSDRYEGTYSYYIYSDNDYIIGRDCCSNICSELRNANSASRQIMPHGELFDATKDIQLEMIQYHSNTTLSNTNALFYNYNPLFKF